MHALQWRKVISVQICELNDSSGHGGRVFGSGFWKLPRTRPIRCQATGISLRMTNRVFDSTHQLDDTNLEGRDLQVLEELDALDVPKHPAQPAKPGANSGV
eukprot:1194474-Prorocentrum_minimum.AAC.8